MYAKIVILSDPTSADAIIIIENKDVVKILFWEYLRESKKSKIDCQVFFIKLLAFEISA